MEQKKSRLLRLTLMGGQARVFICDTTEMAQQARDIHNASNTCSAAMGRMLAATAIMGANLKSEGDRITATINGGGPAGPICAIAGPDGTPVYAADGGTVTYSGWMGGYGYLVEINHGNGYVTRYGHNSSLTVSVGDHVYKGQQIARVGSTGNSTGNHCHFEVRYNGVARNPLNYLP